MTNISHSQQTLIVITGLPGVGKTTVAKMVCEEVGGVHLRNDVIRKDMFKEPSYAPLETCAVYSELFKQCSVELFEGSSVVLDATFDRAGRRDFAQDITESADIRFELVRVVCDSETVRQRLAEREGDVSDADYDVYEMKRSRFDEIQQDYLTVDNSGSLEETREQVRQFTS